jgi:DNA-binding IclR family transcriptional regulator
MDNVVQIPGRQTMVATTVESLETDSPPSSVLGKARLLLEAFTGGNATLGLTELSRRSGVPKASAHRLAVELVELGLLARTPEGYELGWRIYELGRLVPGPARLRSVAYPVLMDLRAALRGVVHLSAAHGTDCVYLERFAGRGDLTLLRAVGARVPCHQTVSGRLLLAYGDPNDVDSTDPDVLAAFRVSAPADLTTKLELIRNQRFADEHEQCLLGFKSVAVPVRYGDQVIAAISSTVGVDRKDDQQVIHALWGASNEISRALQRSSARRPQAPLLAAIS